MRYRILGLIFAGALVAGAAAPASAANKEHQQLMADIRMLQEQSQLLQNMLASLIDIVKVLSTHLDQRFDQQNGTLVKGFADQKLLLDTLSNDARVIRERLDDNNVRIGSLTQEVEALRTAMQQRPATTFEPDPNAAGTTGAPPAGGSLPAPAVGVSPQKMQEAAQADYSAGQYALAIDGFEAYIKNFPRSDWADDAQLFICKSYLLDGKNDKAVEACDAVIRGYPNSNALAEAYYRKGLALSNLKDVAGARAACEAVVKNYKDSDVAILAQQCLDRLRRP
ncbi:MAG TPA: tetratricopeptide repeat protein [Vicinamibacterales bacterium]|jgi:TolA-binding protein|nr:tetratricopeptide repeat protein [Vicinamibacterales bacterium]